MVDFGNSKQPSGTKPPALVWAFLLPLEPQTRSYARTQSTLLPGCTRVSSGPTARALAAWPYALRARARMHAVVQVPSFNAPDVKLVKKKVERMGSVGNMNSEERKQMHKFTSGTEWDTFIAPSVIGYLFP